MSENVHVHIDVRKKITGYCIGFAISLLCTFIAYWIVQQYVTGAQGAFAYHVIIPMLAILAVSQFVVQLVYFLHLGVESKPRWKQLVFWFMIIIVLIIVVGSIWIMNNLNYNMMPPADYMDVKTQRGGF